MSQLKVQFTPDDQIMFPYSPNKHLIGTLKIANNSDFPIVYKFKASTINRFVIRPNQGALKAGQSLDVQIVFHKDGVDNFENQKIQVVYGKSYEEALNKFYTLHISNFAKNENLNLTVMVEDKQKRVKKLESQIKEYASMPKTSTGYAPQKSKSLLKPKNIILVLIIGLVLGFFSPVRMFRKGGLLSFIAETDKQAVEKAYEQE